MKLLTVTNITYAVFYFFIATLPTAIFEYSLSFSLSEINETVDSDQYYICCILFFYSNSAYSRLWIFFIFFPIWN